MNQEQRGALRKMAEESLLKYAPTLDMVRVQPSTILQLLDYIETLEKDAARYRWLSEYFVSDRTDLDDAIVACDSTVALNIVIDAAMQGETE